MASSIKITKDNTQKAKKGADQGNEMAILKACIMVQGQAVALAPVDKGQLKGSIGYKTSKQSEKNLDVSPKKGEGYVGTNVEYGVYQEFGTRFMAPQPFLRPAAQVLKGSKTAIQEEIIRNMGQYLNTFKGFGK